MKGRTSSYGQGDLADRVFRDVVDRLVHAGNETLRFPRFVVASFENARTFHAISRHQRKIGIGDDEGRFAVAIHVESAFDRKSKTYTWLFFV